MNPYAIIGALIILAGLCSWGTYESGQASKWHGQYDSLQASYKTAAVAAETHAQAVEAKQAAEIQAKSDQAIQQATYARDKAQLAAATYQKKLAQLAGKPNLDLPHACANQPIPADLVPQ